VYNWIMIIGWVGWSWLALLGCFLLIISLLCGAVCYCTPQVLDCGVYVGSTVREVRMW
jgi:hypothetical protein